MLTQNKNILLKDKSKKGFTLVELIIVITILAILATIAFISFQGYSKNSRDANRLASLNNIKKGLDIYYTKSANLPIPENPVAIYYSGTLIGQQGYFGDNISRLTGFNKIPLDPLDSTKYTYSVNSDLNKFQALALMETSDYLSFGNNIISKSYAANDYSSRSPKTIGDDLGILLGTGGTDLNRPIQEYYTNTGVDLKTNTGFTAFINNSKSVNGDNLATLKNSLKNGLDNSLISYWDMETYYLSGSNYIFKDLSLNGSDCSLGNSSLTGGIMGSANRINLTNINDECSITLKNGDPFSISFYYKINNEGWTIVAGTGAGLFALREAPKADNAITMYETGGFLYAGVNKDPTSANIAIGKIEIGKWYSVNMTYDGNKYDLYLNGELLYSIISSNSMTNPKLGFYPAQIKSSSVFKYGKGDINVDEVKIYNKALSNTEIQNLYNKIK